jgi:hypothetical protein
MNWLIVVIFATVTGDVYIFTDPTFETRQQCLDSVRSTEDQQGYIRQLLREYGEVMPIAGINCLQEDKIKEILEKHPDAPVKGIAS